MAKFCLDCGKKIKNSSTWCRSCFLKKHNPMKNKEVVDKYFLGENNPFYGKRHSDETIEILRKKNLGELCPAYIDGRTKKQYYCKLCGNAISVKSALYKRGICKKCKHKLHSVVMLGNTNNSKGEKSSNFKHGLPKCVDCGKQLKTYGAVRCVECNGKIHSIKISGKGNPMFGKITHGKGGRYNNIYMRSSYEIAYAKYLDKNNIKWLYEPKAFELLVNGKETTYTPDFYLPDLNRYIEIKGYWRVDAREKFKQFINIYNSIDLIVFGKNELVKMGIL